MSVVWPAALPMPQFGLRYSVTDPQMRTTMASGRTMVRRRFSDVPTEFQARWILTQAEADIFEQFYQHDAVDGTEWIEMPLITVQGEGVHFVRFLGSYRYRRVGPGLWEYSANLQIYLRPASNIFPPYEPDPDPDPEPPLPPTLWGPAPRHLSANTHALRLTGIDMLGSAWVTASAGGFLSRKLSAQPFFHSMPFLSALTSIGIHDVKSNRGATCLISFGNFVYRTTSVTAQPPTWTAISALTDSIDTKIAFCGGSVFVVVSDSGRAARSTNSGSSFSSLSQGLAISSLDLNDIKFTAIDSNRAGVVIAVAMFGRSTISTDNGLNWSELPIGLGNESYTESFTVIKYLGGSRWVAFTDSGAGSISDNNGADWAPFVLDLPGSDPRVKSIASDEAGKVVAVGFSNSLAVSSDSGDSWSFSNVSSLIDESLARFSAVSTNGAGSWLVGSDYYNTALISTDNATTWQRTQPGFGQSTANSAPASITSNKNGTFIAAFTNNTSASTITAISTDSAQSWKPSMASLVCGVKNGVFHRAVFMGGSEFVFFNSGSSVYAVHTTNLIDFEYVPVGRLETHNFKTTFFDSVGWNKVLPGGVIEHPPQVGPVDVGDKNGSVWCFTLPGDGFGRRSVNGGLTSYSLGANFGTGHSAGRHYLIRHMGGGVWVAQLIVGTGPSFKFIKSVDNGATWDNVTFTYDDVGLPPNSFRLVATSSTLILLQVQFASPSYLSNDNGATWSEIWTTDTPRFADGPGERDGSKSKDTAIAILNDGASVIRISGGGRSLVFTLGSTQGGYVKWHAGDVWTISHQSGVLVSFDDGLNWTNTSVPMFDIYFSTTSRIATNAKGQWLMCPGLFATLASNNSQGSISVNDGELWNPYHFDLPPMINNSSVENSFSVNRFLSNSENSWLMTGHVAGSPVRPAFCISNDNGVSWSNGYNFGGHITGTTLTRGSVFYKNVAIVTGTGGLAARSSDYCATWSALPSSLNSHDSLAVNITTIIHDGNGMFMAAGEGGISYSTDNGVNWTRFIDLPQNLFVIDGATDGHGVWVFLRNSAVPLITYDNGATWGTFSLVANQPASPARYGTRIETDGKGRWVILASDGWVSVNVDPE